MYLDNNIFYLVNICNIGDILSKIKITKIELIKNFSNTFGWKSLNVFSAECKSYIITCIVLVFVISGPKITVVNYRNKDENVLLMTEV